MGKILVVDDETLMLKLAQKVLGELYEVSFAQSGAEALVLCGESEPDLIMIDLGLPDMDGFELAQQLGKQCGGNVPIIFMDEDEDGELEGLGFDMGAEDFIHKPIVPSALLHRVKRTMDNHEKIRTLKEETKIDPMTGFYNKTFVAERLTEVCAVEVGTLLVIDLDSFKLVNDLYGHEMGDRILAGFAEIIRTVMSVKDVIGRVGGDEFVAFLEYVVDEDTVAHLTRQLNERICLLTRDMLGEDCLIPIGVSVGAVYVPTYGTDYSELFHKADKALYVVKQNGKHGYRLYQDQTELMADDTDITDELRRVSMVLEERNVTDHALVLGQEDFQNVYRFLLRYINRYGGGAYKVLMSLIPNTDDDSDLTSAELVDELEDVLKHSFRSSDIIMHSKANQFFLLLPNVTDGQIETVMDRAMEAWEASGNQSKAQLMYETEQIIAG